MITRTLLIVLLLSVGMHACRSQENTSTEKLITEKINQFMSSYDKQKLEGLFDGIASWGAEGSNEGTNPLLEDMRQFCQKNELLYRHVRTESLKRYLPAPDLHTGYEVLEITDLNQYFDLIQDVSNIRTLDAGDTRTMTAPLLPYVLDYLNAARGITVHEVIDKIASGDLLFADQIDEDHWKLTYVSRLHVFRFNWNILNNRTSDRELAVYMGEERPVRWLEDGHFTGDTPVRKLWSNIQAFRWSLGDVEQNNSTSFDDVEILTERFMTAHRSAYIAVRKSILKELPDMTNAWNATYQQESEMTEDLKDNLGIVGRTMTLPLRVSMLEYGYKEVLAELRMCVVRKKQYSTEDLQKHYLSSWLLGDDVQAREVRDDVWEIVAFVEDYALHYRWNIVTDEIEEITCWQKRK